MYPDDPFTAEIFLLVASDQIVFLVGPCVHPELQLLDLTKIWSQKSEMHYCSEVCGQ